MDFTCGVFLISNDNKLLICHPTGHGHGNVWSIPKGLVDKGETYVQAAHRELMEETDIEINIKNLSQLPQQIYKSKKKTLVPFVAKLVKNSFEINTQCHSFFQRNENLIPEVDKFEWINFNNIELTLHESQINVWNKYLKHIFV